MKAWDSFRDALFAFAKFTLGHKERKHQDWFKNNNAENASLLKQKRETFTNWLHEKTSATRHDRLKHLRKKVQTELRQMKNKWWQHKAAELEQYSDEHNFKRFFEGLKTVYGPSSNAMAPVPSSDGTLLTGTSDIVQRCKKTFNQLLNRPSQIDQEAIQEKLQRLVLSSLDDRPTLEETQKNVKQLQAGEAPVPDGIPPKIFKEGGEVIAVKLTELMQQFWDKDLVPQEFKDANMIYLY